MKFFRIKLPSAIRSIEALDKIGVIIGLVMIGKGLYMVYPPLMYIAIGLILAFPGIPGKAVK